MEVTSQIISSSYYLIIQGIIEKICYSLCTNRVKIDILGKQDKIFILQGIPEIFPCFVYL